MSEAVRREDAFRSALKRLPLAVIIVDDLQHLQPYNGRAQILFEREGLCGDLLKTRPLHPLSQLIGEIVSSADHPDERTLTFPSGQAYRIEPSRRSEKGMNRWLMLLVTPAAEVASFDSFNFTPREREVAEMLMAGSSGEEICRSLSIGRDTLKSHMSHLFEKTGTNSRACLVARLLRPK